MLPTRSLRTGAAMVALAALVAGCGGSAAPASPSAPAASGTSSTAPKPASVTKILFRLPWTIGGYDAPFVLAEANGYYKAVGLDVNIQEGKGSATTAETVGNGSDPIGFADDGTVAKLVSKGDPVKVVATFVQQTPMSFIHDPSFTIKTPHDLVGHPIITSAGDADRQILPAVLAKAGMTMSQLKFDMVDPAAYPTTFVKTPNAVMLGYSNDDLQNLQKIDPKALAQPYSDYGVNLLNLGIITSDSMLKQHPDEVRAFVAASVKGWEAAVKDPKAAVDATLKAFPHAEAAEISAGLDATLKMLHTANTQGKPLGWMAPADWQQTVDILHQYAGMTTVKPIADYYTDDYLPKS